MSGKTEKIAIPTEGNKGLEDTVSNVFGRSKTFTIITITANKVESVEIKENPTISYKHGAGPIVAKMLVDMGVNKVIAGEIGPGVSTLLDEFNIKKVKVEPGTHIRNILKT